MCGHFMQEIKNVIFDSLHFYDTFIGECYWQKVYYSDLSCHWFLLVDKKVNISRVL